MKRILWLLPALFAFATVSSAQTRLPVVTLTLSQSTAVEGEPGAGVLLVQRNEGLENSLRVFFRVSGSARNGVDYQRLRGSVDIPAGADQAQIAIIPRDDNRREPTERVTVQLRPAPRNSPPYRLGALRSQSIQILDDDQPAAPGPPPVARPRPWFPLPGIITNPTNTTTTTP